MFLAQPLLIVALLILAGAVAAGLRARRLT
jgi:hypothetical protein